MRILLTGSKSQLARCLRDRLPEDWETIATDSASLDITDADAVCNMVKSFQPDAIVNTAAYTAVDKAEGNAAAAFAVNASAVYNLALAAHRAHARFVHISTDYVFDGKSKNLTRKATLPTLPMYTDNPKPPANCSHCLPIPTALSCGLLGCLANTGTTLSAPC